MVLLVDLTVGIVDQVLVIDFAIPNLLGKCSGGLVGEPPRFNWIGGLRLVDVPLLSTLTSSCLGSLTGSWLIASGKLIGECRYRDAEISCQQNRGS